jgi:probable addiction module antidote protein
MSANTSQLDSLEAIAGHLADAFESGDPAVITAALSAVAMAPAFPELAAATGIPRQQLADALYAGELPLDIALGIMKVIDLHLPGGRR